MSAGPALPPSFLEAMRDFTRRRTGLVFQPNRYAAFEAGLVRAMRRARLTDPKLYLDRIEADPGLLDDLVGEITVGETYFFREPAQFSYLRQVILPAFLGRTRSGPGGSLRIWSAGCASGEEAYTLAIVLLEQSLKDCSRVMATDLSRGALAAARRAVYSRWALRGVPDSVLQTYFTQTGERFTLKPGIREAVDFRYLNLAEDAYPSLLTGIWGMDLILCRNVLIYFDLETVARVGRRLLDSLSDDGWLLLGASDPPLGDLAPCEVVVTEAGLAYRRQRPAALTIAAPSLERRPQPLAPLAVVQPVAAVQPKTEVAEENLALAAVQSYRDRDYPRAAELARQAVERDPRDPQPWIVLVRALANRGELALAGEACATALDRNRTSAELTYLHAVLLAEGSRVREAAAAARQALYLDRQLIVAHLLLGSSLARSGDPDGAARSLGNAQRLLGGMPPDANVPASDGEPAGRLAEMVRLQLELLRGVAA